MIKAIADRRSIRKYRQEEVPRQVLMEVIRAGMAAPSSKNRQPWKFIVVTGESKSGMLEAFARGLKRERTDPLLPESAEHLRGAEYTLEIMRQAPAVIFIVNPLGLNLQRTVTPEERIFEICNAQSVGAAAENMALAATELGLGSLWICDTYFAYEELSEWLHAEGELFAAMAIGYAAEAPSPRPRKAESEAVEWRS